MGCVLPHAPSLAPALTCWSSSCCACATKSWNVSCTVPATRGRSLPGLAPANSVFCGVGVAPMVCSRMRESGGTTMCVKQFAVIALVHEQYTGSSAASESGKASTCARGQGVDGCARPHLLACYDTCAARTHHPALVKIVEQGVRDGCSILSWPSLEGRPPRVAPHFGHHQRAIQLGGQRNELQRAWQHDVSKAGGGLA